jgi:hypothetical protein
VAHLYFDHDIYLPGLFFFAALDFFAGVFFFVDFGPVDLVTV